MIDALVQFALFLCETAVIVVAVLIILGGIGSVLSKGKEGKKCKLKIKKLNKHYHEQRDEMQQTVLDKKAFKAYRKTNKNKKKAGKDKNRERVFVLDFQGDIKASQVDDLREEVSAILAIANSEDEVVLRLESPGGIVPGYGLAASQLIRLKEKKIPLTICVDKVAASGGYMMACVADKLLAAPFAIIGSVGVVAQLPNFHRYLQDKKIDFEQVTAGDYKRTLTIFGKNTKEGREKFQEDLNEIHHQFKEFVAEYRPQLNISRIATGEHWLGYKALQLKLVDNLKVSDDYLMEKLDHADIFALSTYRRKRFGQKMADSMQMAFDRLVMSWWQRDQEQQHLS